MRGGWGKVYPLDELAVPRHPHPNPPPQAGEGANLPRFPRSGAGDPAAFSPLQMIEKQAKRRKCGAINLIFVKTSLSFALPSLPQPAYPELSGRPVCAGTGGPFLFFDSAETT
jgi:hypothetical protein